MKDERCDLLCLDAPRAEAIRRARLDVEVASDAAERARALSDPTRLMLAAALREGGELCVRPRLDLRARPEPRLAPPAHLALARRRHISAGRQARNVLPHRARARAPWGRIGRKGGCCLMS